MPFVLPAALLFFIGRSLHANILQKCKSLLYHPVHLKFFRILAKKSDMVVVIFDVGGGGGVRSYTPWSDFENLTRFSKYDP